MRQPLKTYLGIFLALGMPACQQRASQPVGARPHESHYSRPIPTATEGGRYPDGTYMATIDYFNPETGYSAAYTLPVDVENEEVVQINFPNGGWLDGHHVDPAPLNDDGSASLESDRGATYEVQIIGRADSRTAEE